MASSIVKGLVTEDGIDRLRNGNQRRRAETSPYSHTRFRTCHHISTDTNLQGPRSSIVIMKAFPFQTSGLVQGSA